MDRFLLEAYDEDIGRGDLFEKCFEKQLRVKAQIVAKQTGILAGMHYVLRLFELKNVDVEFALKDGENLQKGERIIVVYGEYTDLLKIERVALNILQHASGIATHTRKFVEALGESRVKLLDTRKTRPLLREFEKYATQIGGAINHRMGLDDCLMLKDTHMRHIENLDEFLKKARKSIPFTSKIEVECSSVDEAIAAFEAGADIVMCDNMSLEDIKTCVALRNDKYPNILIEASGNVSAENIKEYDLLGVDAISSGSIIHQATWLDFSMKMI